MCPLLLLQALHELFLLVLEVGNFMNHGTNHGRAEAISLTTLDQLAGVRSTAPKQKGQKGQVTLMNALAKMISRKNAARMEAMAASADEKGEGSKGAAESRFHESVAPERG